MHKGCQCSQDIDSVKFKLTMTGVCFRIKDFHNLVFLIIITIIYTINTRANAQFMIVYKIHYQLTQLNHT